MRKLALILVLLAPVLSFAGHEESLEQLKARAEAARPADQPGLFLNIADRQVLLEVGYCKLWCEHCGKTRVEHLGFCDSPQRLTHRLRRYIYHLCKLLPVTQVAQGLHRNQYGIFRTAADHFHRCAQPRG